MRWALALIAISLTWPSVARAQERITIGLYAPTVPFDSLGQRLEMITGLAKHLSSVARGKQVTGRVFARAGALAAAIRKGTVQMAVVDAPYAAARGLPYRILGASLRRGRATGAWVMVASAKVRSLADLRGKAVVVPRIGSNRQRFVTNVLLEGEVGPGYFKAINVAPDPQSAVTMVKLGRAAAAFVPAATGASGLRRVVALRAVGFPMLVAARGFDLALAQALARRARSYRGAGFSGFAAASAGGYASLRGSFGGARKRGPMARPAPSRLVLGGVLGQRVFPMPVRDLRSLVR